ncbi:hypothetical protein [Streptomyces sp. SP17KL33]|uniref:hypothetical protein n=1 Tax=Streptomyces sp. SP17KL33 TaxID=3002534 RepID=UPI002E79D5EA|nr:hypothetical protein [Streptomyces sp. SP17KL33]MEE1838148.1 hypothetical protein [Streptomyces sp. SP17KL33]
MNLFAVRAEDIACTTKVWYPSKHQAKKAWKRLRRQPGRRHLEWYRCGFCRMYHLGNPRGHQTYIRRGRPSITPTPELVVPADHRPEPAAAPVEELPASTFTDLGRTAA